MDTRLHLEILPQPDDFTCGPTCLQAVYSYYGDRVPLAEVIAETPRLEEGGTFAVLLAIHALRRGYDATIYTYNLQMFDPTWFRPDGPDLRERLEAQAHLKRSRKLREATRAYLEYLELGGNVRFEDLTTALIRKYLTRQVPILTGLSSTYLYRNMREFGPKDDPDDVRGVPQGHFVVLCGYNREERSILVADPLATNPVSPKQQLYEVNIDRVVCATLLGVLTYDANLLIIRPKSESA
jgi:hypothetical protein